MNEFNTLFRVELRFLGFGHEGSSRTRSNKRVGSTKKLGCTCVWESCLSAHKGVARSNSISQLIEHIGHEPRRFHLSRRFRSGPAMRISIMLRILDQSNTTQGFEGI